MGSSAPYVRFSVALLAVVAVGCAAGRDHSGGPVGADRIGVVAAENFYGDIAGQLGGRYVRVTSILSDPNADPHLFEPGTANAAAVAHARLVIRNGLGYDAFMDRLLAAAPSSERTVVAIGEALHVGGGNPNPHLWYDLPRVPEMARAIAAGLMAVDPAHRSYFNHRLSGFDASLGPLNDAVAAIKTRSAGAPVAYTEPVPGYMLEAAGLVIRTPDDFARAIEEGNDPPPQAVAAMEGLLTSRQVRVLLYNSQATSPITDRIRVIAGQNGIPVVAVTETLPPGMTFQAWQLGQVKALAKALSR